MHANPNPNLFMDTFNLNKRYSIFPVSHHLFQRVIETAGEKKAAFLPYGITFLKRFRQRFVTCSQRSGFSCFTFTQGGKET